MKKIIRWLIKAFAAGITAIAIISGLLCFYYILPVHIANSKGNTDYIWPGKSRWIKLTEGASWGTFDENGYNNPSVIQNPDIVILGSSHMEATNVTQDHSMGYLLGQKLAGQYTVYNMGIAGHFFAKVCQYLPATMELNDTVPQITIIETSSVNVSQKDVENILNKTVPYDPSYSDGWIGAAQRVPFFRMVSKQIDSGLLKLFRSPKPKSVVSASKKTVEISEEAYDRLFAYLADIEKGYGTQLLIFYHPFETLHKDGSIDYLSDPEHLDIFRTYADAYGIDFLDLTDTFTQMFYTEHHTAHGFFTGKLGSGHMNAYGHAAAAEAIYNEIQLIKEEVPCP